MPRTITLHAAALRYVLPHVGTEESRPNLHGVLIEPSGLAVATNGHTLGVHRTAADRHDAAALLRFHEPRKLTAAKVETIAIALPDMPDTAPVAVTLYDSVGRTIGATLADMMDPQDFPTWRNVYRPREDGQPVPSIGLDPALADRFAVKVGRQTGKVSVAFDGASGCMLVRYPDEPNALGLWMPCRDVVTGAAVAAWDAVTARPTAPDAAPDAAAVLAEATP
jgi:hypothetical protein